MRAILTGSPETPVLARSGASDHVALIPMVPAGADGYVAREAPPPELDGSLTRSLEQDPRRRSLAAALIEFGRESGASVLAEHIESELQLAELRRLGVKYGQGYHLGRPRRAPMLAAHADAG